MTEPTSTAPAALAGLKVLDLTGSYLQYAGKLFAQMGADVVLVEPPGGSATRREGPYVDDREDIEYSLTFAYLNQAKRGIVLDLDKPADQQLLRALASEADLLIEGEKPGVMARRGLDATSLQALNPRLVVCSITPFGQTGPWAHWECEDIVALALGGLLRLAGEPGEAPVAAWGNQAWLAGAQFGSVAALAALTQRDISSGVGQHVDVSIQEAVTMGLENAIQFLDLEGVIRQRTGSEQRQAGTGLFSCKDGKVYFMAGGLDSAGFWQSAANWLIESDAPGAKGLLDPEWLNADFRASVEAKQRFADIFLPFAAQRTKAELYAEGQKRRIPICPLSTTADLLENRQLAYRSYFKETFHPASGRSFLVPGAPYRLIETPWRLGAPAPRLGEHTEEVLAALRTSKTTKQEAVA